jgi:sensor histidine kinase YesM
MIDPRLAVRIALDAWSGITRKQLVATFLFGLALFAYHVASGMVFDDSFEWLPALTIMVADQIKVWPIFLAYLIVEHMGDPGQSRRIAYAMAAIAGTLVAAPLTVVFVSFVFNLYIHPARPQVGFMVYIGLETAMLGAAVLWVVNDRRRALRARARMHGAEMERIAAEKRSIESDLQAMQARVEPQFLFNTLAQVRELYDKHAGRAERMLDELIAYLRAAMPKMRDTSSTLGQELDLARAYLAIVGMRQGDRFEHSTEGPAQLRAFRFPPMMLLPLLDHATASGTGPADAPRSIRIDVDATRERLVVRIADSGRGFDPKTAGGAIDGIRERLTTLFGRDATLELSLSADAGTRAVMQLPIETVASSP